MGRIVCADAGRGDGGIVLRPDVGGLAPVTGGVAQVVHRDPHRGPFVDVVGDRQRAVHKLRQQRGVAVRGEAVVVDGGGGKADRVFRRVCGDDAVLLLAAAHKGAVQDRVELQSHGCAHVLDRGGDREPVAELPVDLGLLVRVDADELAVVRRGGLRRGGPDPAAAGEDDLDAGLVPAVHIGGQRVIRHELAGVGVVDLDLIRAAELQRGGVRALHEAVAEAHDARELRTAEEAERSVAQGDRRVAGEIAGLLLAVGCGIDVCGDLPVLVAGGLDQGVSVHVQQDVGHVGVLRAGRRGGLGKGEAGQQQHLRTVGDRLLDDRDAVGLLLGVVGVVEHVGPIRGAVRSAPGFGRVVDLLVEATVLDAALVRDQRDAECCGRGGRLARDLAPEGDPGGGYDGILVGLLAQSEAAGLVGVIGEGVSGIEVADPDVAVGEEAEVQAGRLVRRACPRGVGGDHGQLVLAGLRKRARVCAGGICRHDRQLVLAAGKRVEAACSEQRKRLVGEADRGWVCGGSFGYEAQAAFYVGQEAGRVSPGAALGRIRQTERRAAAAVDRALAAVEQLGLYRLAQQLGAAPARVRLGRTRDVQRLAGRVLDHEVAAAGDQVAQARDLLIDGRGLAAAGADPGCGVVVVAQRRAVVEIIVGVRRGRRPGRVEQHAAVVADGEGVQTALDAARSVGGDVGLVGVVAGGRAAAIELHVRRVAETEAGRSVIGRGLTPVAVHPCAQGDDAVLDGDPDGVLCAAVRVIGHAQLAHRHQDAARLGHRDVEPGAVVGHRHILVLRLERGEGELRRVDAGGIGAVVERQDAVFDHRAGHGVGVVFGRLIDAEDLSVLADEDVAVLPACHEHVVRGDELIAPRRVLGVVDADAVHVAVARGQKDKVVFPVEPGGVAVVIGARAGGVQPGAAGRAVGMGCAAGCGAGGRHGRIVGLARVVADLLVDQDRRSGRGAAQAELRSVGQDEEVFGVPALAVDKAADIAFAERPATVGIGRGVGEGQDVVAARLQILAAVDQQRKGVVDAAFAVRRDAGEHGEPVRRRERAVCQREGDGAQIAAERVVIAVILRHKQIGRADRIEVDVGGLDQAVIRALVAEGRRVAACAGEQRRLREQGAEHRQGQKQGQKLFLHHKNLAFLIFHHPQCNTERGRLQEKRAAGKVKNE